MKHIKNLTKYALFVLLVCSSFENTSHAQAFLNAYKTLVRPQDPIPPFPYICEEVSFTNERDSVSLAGTLSLPEEGNSFPAVILVTGSGTQNRDEELMGHKPFAVIADYLTRNGIAVLRYDDRGAGSSDKGKPGATTIDLSYDAEAALEFLLNDSRIDNTRIGIIGHSEGGTINWIVASRRTDDVKFVISLAGPATKGSEILAAQQRALYKASGIPEASILANEQLFSQIWKIIENNSSIEKADVELKKLLGAMGATEEQINAYRSQLLEPWMYAFITLEPKEYIQKATCKALVLNGTKDLQVISSQNIPIWETLAKDRKPGSEITIVELDGLNHLFQHCNTGLPAEYQEIPETISNEVLDIIKDYILSIK